MKAKLIISTLLLAIFSHVIQAQEEIVVGSTTRNMIVYAPVDIPEHNPLIIAMHGYNQDAPYLQEHAQWEPIADTANFVVVYPNGINKAWDISGTSDLDFILTIIDTMYNRYAIDTNRVYLSGFSMGGMMTYYAATQIADKIAAFAPVSGYPMAGPNVSSSRPVPIIHTHGTTDDVVEYEGAQPNLDAWIKRNACPEIPKITKPYPKSKNNSIATMSYWGPGNEGSAVALLTLAGKGHWWSMDVSLGVSTSAEIWKFVKNYTLDTIPNSISLSSATLSNLSYDAGSGPSAVKSCYVYGGVVTEDADLRVSDNFEITLDTTDVFSSSLVIAQNEGTIDSTEVFARLKADLPIANYKDTLYISSDGTFDRIVLLTGSVADTTVAPNLIETATRNSGRIIAKEYYDLSGRRISDIANYSGMLIERITFSDGSFSSQKIVITR